MCDMKHDVDLLKKSKEFASRLRRAQRKMKYSGPELSRLTGISISRLGELSTGNIVFTKKELQLLGITHGIAFDELFPLEVPQERIHKLFTQLASDGVGLIAPTQGPTTPRKPMKQRAFERSIVHLHHCHECLQLFPQ